MLGTIVKLLRLAQFQGAGHAAVHVPDQDVIAQTKLRMRGDDLPGDSPNDSPIDPFRPAVPVERRKEKKFMGTFSDSKMPQSANANNRVELPTSSLSDNSAPVNSSAANQYSMIGKSIVIKGEITASDPVYVYGSVEGSIIAPEHRVTVGKEGRVKADIKAREVVVMGDVCGNLDGGERVEIRSDGSLLGNLTTRRIYIEEGAVLSGSIDIQAPAKKKKPEAEKLQEVPELDGGSPVAELVSEIAS